MELGIEYLRQDGWFGGGVKTAAAAATNKWVSIPHVSEN